MVTCLQLSAKKTQVLRIWDIVDIACSAGSAAQTTERSAYTSAKIVLVGESNVGKSCLAMRLAEDRYPDDHEHGTTHGMQFWPMEATTLHSSAKAAGWAAAGCGVVGLWRTE